MLATDRHSQLRSCSSGMWADNLGSFGRGAQCAFLGLFICYNQDMCGIIGYIGPKDATPILMNGLRRMEYRGYDSAGVALIDDGKTTVIKRKGKISALAEAVESARPTGHV